MQRYIGAILSACLIVPTVTISVKAQMPANKNSASHITPFNLAYLAYWGYLQKQGVPGGDRLIFAFESGKITTQDIVRGAIAIHRLPKETLADEGYLHALKEQLKSFEQN